MNIPKSLSGFSHWLVMAWILAIFTRIVETISLNQHHFVFHLIPNEIIGVGIDILLLTTLFVFLFPFYYLLSRISMKGANIFTGSFLGTVFILHLFIIQYFIYSCLPLGGFFLAHTFEEVRFTLSTLENSYLLFSIMLISIILLLITLRIFLKRCNFSKPFLHIITFFSLFAVVCTFFIHSFFNKIDLEAQPYSVRINKSWFFYRNLASIVYHRHTNQPLAINLSERNELFPDKHFLSDDYPLLTETDFNDVLGGFFNSTTDKQPPNIVFIIVEGLGSRFLPDFHGLKVMPFVDSLTQKSLYWENALTVGERSFSVVPSLLASAPHGKRGFTFENENLLSLSLVNMLSGYGYYSTFFYGQPSWFHNKKPYLSRNGINKFVDCYQFPEKYQRIMVGDYFWGHHDQDLFKYALELLNDSLPETPRLDIYFTGTMHAPFIIDNEDYYDQRLRELVQQAELSNQKRKFFQKYGKYVRTTLFADDALRSLFAGYQKLPYYHNTIFIITGDHPMSEIPIEDRYKRYRVPVIIYSPLLKQAKTFQSVNSHLDIAPTLLTFLHQNYTIEIPKQNAFIGKTMDTSATFRNTQPVVFMSGERFIKDIYYDDYFLSHEKFLYKVLENGDLEPCKENYIKTKMLRMLHNFKSLNSYCCENNKLIPHTLYYEGTGNEILYKFDHQSYSIRKEYEWGEPVIEDLIISYAGQYFFDFYINDPEKIPNNVPVLVFESFDNSTGERLFWHGFDLNENNGFIHFSFDIPRKKEVKIKSYFWNNKQQECELLNTSCYLYRLGKK